MVYKMPENIGKSALQFPEVQNDHQRACFVVVVYSQRKLKKSSKSSQYRSCKKMFGHFCFKNNIDDWWINQILQSKSIQHEMPSPVFIILIFKEKLNADHKTVSKKTLLLRCGCAEVNGPSCLCLDLCVTMCCSSFLY